MNLDHPAMPETLIQPDLFFEGCCEEAVEFYRQARGAEVLMMMRYKESPEPPPRKIFAALREGGQAAMPLGKTFGSPCFGMLADRFGLGGIVAIPEEKP
jgi:PhnB protein